VEDIGMGYVRHAFRRRIRVLALPLPFHLMAATLIDPTTTDVVFI
jgi:hypothetical protein